MTGPDPAFADRLREPTLEQRSVNTIRALVLDAVQEANSGHPGAPLGMADAAYVLWSRFLRFDPARPDWPNRDRFVLSAGHASMLLYALLHLTGYAVSLDDLRRFRQWGSITPGHPEADLTPGVETTTGPLGQGISTAVGLALAERHLAARLNTGDTDLVDHRTYVLASDGDLMEGVQAEACSLAGHLGLGKLIVLYDDNRITIDGSTDLTFSENVSARFAAYGWQVQSVDGHDRNALEAALARAVGDDARPSLVLARTHIAAGSPHKQDTAASHGAPLGEEEVRLAKMAYGLPPDKTFFVAEDVRAHFQALGRRHTAERVQWERTFADYRARNPQEAKLWDALHDPNPPGPDDERPAFSPGQSVATRKASLAALGWLLPRVPALVGGSADLEPSNLTRPEGDPAFSRQTPEGRYLHFGVREHAMAAILNGIARHGGLLPYGGTFLVFSDYLRPALRLAAMMQTRVVFVFTHDSVLLGEDGPTHQPVAQIASLRAIPGLTVIRPSDAVETVAAWEVALERPGPTALLLTRQGVPVLDRDPQAAREAVYRGAAVVFDGGQEPLLVAFATGSEVSVTVEAARMLAAEGKAVRVVAVPSWELFFEQDEALRERILAPEVPHRMAVEAAAPFGWERFVGREGRILGMDRFGASAPGAVLQEQFGFTATAIAAAMREELETQ